jgi:REP element-mobilizing transposase RayT
MYTDPLAYFITFTSYGTWLPGDDRGWTMWHKGDKLPQPLLADWCRDQMKELPVFLDDAQREIVENTIALHCQLRDWRLHAVNCRSNHCHVVVTANSHDGEQVRDQFKAWCTRKLKESVGRNTPGVSLREHWWTAKGSVRLIFDEDSLFAAITYALEAQDAGGSKVSSVKAEGRKPSGDVP